MEETNREALPLGPFYRDQRFMHMLRITAVAFAVLLVLASVVGLLVPSIPAELAQQFRRTMDDADVMNGDGSFNAVAIFLHNLDAMAWAVVYGLIPFLHLPALLLGVNAVLLGAMAAQYINSGMSLLLYLVGVIPHGIFEIPAIILALTCGLYLCSYLTGRIIRRSSTPRQPVFRRIAQVFCLVIAPLLVLAALVEAYVTPLILNSLL